MTWDILYSINTVLDAWVISQPIQGSLFRLNHLSNSNDFLDFRGVIAQAFIEGEITTIFDSKRIAYKEDPELFFLLQPSELANRRIAIRRLDNSTSAWDIIVEVLNGMPEYLIAPININQVDTLPIILNGKADVEELELVETSILSLNSAIATKASIVQVSVLETVLAGKADDADLTPLVDAIATKASIVQVSVLETALAGKADDADLTPLVDAIATKASIVQVSVLETALAGKADDADLTPLVDAIATKASIVQVSVLETALAGKADDADLTPLVDAIATKASRSANLSDLANITLARSNLEAAKKGVNDDITSLSALTTPALGNSSTNVSTTEFSQQLYKPAFLIHCAPSHSINTTLAKISFGNQEINTHSAIASSEFTVPVGLGGLYLFGISIRITKDTTAGNVLLRLRCNDISFLSFDNKCVASDIISPTGQSIKYLVAGDRIAAWAQTSAGGAVAGDTNAVLSSFFGYRLGI